MKKSIKTSFIISASLFITFIIYTISLLYIDVNSIGPNGSSVGYSTLNKAFHSLTGVHMNLYTITDWLSIIAILFVLFFGVIGVIQLFKRKSLLKVDNSILVLGCFYIVVFIVYFLFEFVVVNYRPILIENVLEASYPSSTTVLVICVISTTIMQFNNLIKNVKLKRIINIAIGVFGLLMVTARIISGVHWLTDIVGGFLISSSLVMLYYSIIKYIDNKKIISK